MPKRSNTFQRLVAAVHSDLEGWKVTESTFLRDSVTGEEREVDIVATTTIGGYELVLCIECRDHERAADVCWVEGMAKKHEHLSTSKLVLWSRSGFTKPAIRKAKALKIDTVLKGELADKKWAELAKAFVKGRFKFVQPKFTAFVDVELSSGKRERFKPCDHLALGDENIPAEPEIGKILPTIYAMPEIRTAVLDHAPVGDADFYVEWTFPGDLYVWDQDQKIGKLTRIGIGIETSTETSSLIVRSAVHNDAVHTVATAKINIGEIDFIVKEVAGLPPAICARFIGKRKNE
jgi:hypothetical protein